jgi:hypothetical protein
MRRATHLLLCQPVPEGPLYGYVVGVGQVMVVGQDGIGVSCRRSCRSHCPATQVNRSMPRHTPTAMVRELRDRERILSTTLDYLRGLRIRYVAPASAAKSTVMAFAPIPVR